MDRLVFLDIDGVMTSRESIEYFHALNPDQERLDMLFGPAAVGHLNDLLLASGAKVVISSTWRKYYTIDWLRCHFEDQGVLCEIIDLTPYLWRQKRGDEIQKWLDEHPPPEGVERPFVILDDDSDMVHLRTTNFVKVGNRTGLRRRDVEKALKILKVDVDG